MIFFENRYPPRIKPGESFFGTMLYSIKVSADMSKRPIRYCAILFSAPIAEPRRNFDLSIVLATCTMSLSNLVIRLPSLMVANLNVWTPSVAMGSCPSSN